MKGRVLLVALALSFLGLTGMAEGATFNVSNQTDFQNALTNAASNGEDDTINVNNNITISATLTYSTNDGDGGHTLTIQGNGHTLNGGNSVQIMNINTDISNNGGDANGDVAIDNLTFQNGNFSGNGGGLYIRTGLANITLTNNTFSNNGANYGGGAFVLTYSGTSTLTNNTFSENTAAYGGGARVSTYSGTSTLTNNTFSNNTATYGGGAYVYTNSGTSTLTGNTFSNNTAGNWGGGARVELFDDTATANIYNNIIYGNTANGGGNDGDDLLVVSDGDGNTTGSPVNLYNNDLTCNDFDGSSTCLVVADTDNYTQGNNISQNPLFVDAPAGDFHLQAGSPCIDVGDNNAPFLPTTDFEGDPRKYPPGGIVDIGADEYKPQQQPQAVSVPTMTEWGMIVFMILAGLVSVYYLRRGYRL